MSNARPFRRRRPRISRTDADAVTALTCATRGCICEPDIVERHTNYGAERSVLHDDWCPAANTGTAYTLIPGPHTDPHALAEAVRDLLNGEHDQ